MEQGLPSGWDTTRCCSQVLNWEDNRTAAMIKGNVNYTSCNLFCNSVPDEIRNAANQPACCDGIYIPSVRDAPCSLWLTWQIRILSASSGKA